MRIKQHASPEALDIMWERFQYIQTQMVQEYLNENHQHQQWTLVPASKLKRIWSGFTAAGFVRDEKGLLDVQERMLENLCRIEVNNIVSGHTSMSMETVLEDYFGEDSEQVIEHQDKFCDWAVDLPDGGWRISDYGTPKMFDLIALAIGAESAEERLVYLDMALNVIHQRSDLASWFIEGGRQTLSEISGEGFSRKGNTMNTPSIMTVNQYVQKNGFNCPHCGSTNVCVGEWNSVTRSQDVSCGACESQWVDNYDLVNYVELLDRDGNEIAIPEEPEPIFEQPIAKKALLLACAHFLCDSDDLTLEEQFQALESAEDGDVPAGVIPWEPFENFTATDLFNDIEDLRDLILSGMEYAQGIAATAAPVTNKLHDLILDLHDSADNCGCEHPLTVCDEEKLHAVYLESKKQKSAQPPHLAVVLDGGLVQSIVSDNPEYFAGVKTMVIDYDTDSLDPTDETLGLVEQDDGALAAGYIRGESITAAGVNLERANAFINETDYGATQQRLAACGDNPCEGCPDVNLDGEKCVNQEKCLAWQYYAD